MGLTVSGSRIPPPANDGVVVDFDAADEARLDELMRATVPLLRSVLARAIVTPRPRLPLRPRHGARVGDDAPVDEVTRARARALLARHGHRGGAR